MARKSIPKDMWETYRAMSVDVGREVDFLKETACMNQEQRIMIAHLNTAKRIINHPDFDMFIDEVAIPHLKQVGMASWGRDVVTDLGFALAGRKSQYKNIKKILEFKLVKKDGKQ